MESERITTQTSYRIESKAGGGFIAHPTEGNGNTLEAPTREELQQKICQESLSSVYAKFPGLKVALEDKTPGTTFHIDQKPDGRFAAHSDDPNAEVIEGATKEEVETKLVQKYLGSASNGLLQNFVQAMNAQGSTDIKVVVKRKSGTTALPNLNGMGFRSAQSTASRIETLNPQASVTTNYGTVGGSLDNTPIVPETGNRSKLIALVLAVLVASALYYFFGR